MAFCDLDILSSEYRMNSSSEMRDYYVHSENFTENELIIDHVHESREINYLLSIISYFTNHGITFVHGSREIISIFHDSRQLKIGIHGSQKNPLSDPLMILNHFSSRIKHSYLRIYQELVWK